MGPRCPPEDEALGGGGPPWRPPHHRGSGRYGGVRHICCCSKNEKEGGGLSCLSPAPSESAAAAAAAAIDGLRTARGAPTGAPFGLEGPPAELSSLSHCWDPLHKGLWGESWDPGDAGAAPGAPPQRAPWDPKEAPQAGEPTDVWRFETKGLGGLLEQEGPLGAPSCSADSGKIGETLSDGDEDEAPKRGPFFEPLGAPEREGGES